MEEIININEVAMEVILHAGDGRMKIDAIRKNGYL